MILTEEGYATLSGSTPTYYYYLKDHQGNNRVVVNQGGAVQQVNHYYPFGGLFGEGIQTVNQPYKYNGKELDRFEGLDMYDYGARHYDAAIGRWGTVDPLAEGFYAVSPYVYVANNPIRFIDPTGMWIDDYSINEKEKRITILKQPGNTDRIFDKDNPKGREIEKGSFDIEKYRNEGYKVESLAPVGMAMTDLGLSVFGGEIAAAKIGTWIGKGISAWKAGRTAKGAEIATKAGGNVAKERYTFTKSAGKHLTEVVKRGENAGQLARPYMKSPLTIQEIMSMGKNIPDATFKGGMNWKVPGTFRGSQGIWELGINPNTNVIYHFNFVH